MNPVMCVVGARPNFMKMAPILRALAAHVPPIPALLLHTGQHYDKVMSDQLFRDLGLPAPDINLEVGYGTHAVQTAEVMRRFEPALDEHKPSCVVVVGDVNSTLACTLVAVKKNVPVVHVEAGLRSGDRRMPEEINRVLTDQVADRLYTTERSAGDNLVREDAATLRPLLEVLHRISRRLPLVFALHPRTRSNIERFGLQALADSERMVMLPPQGYLEMLGLMAGAALVLTDSGGLQEETTALGVPCLTMRENTERPITVEQGTNTMVGRDTAAIVAGVDEILAGRGKQGRVPELWDGHAAERIAADLYAWLGEQRG
ncbi:MAG: UDP-N-acetyl glucosamine 2-epimerase [Burkholderiales bacterium]|nr:UDP-N-acetyl glucosamine 2-epimerase [Burkholderiales bacterium]